MTAEERRPTAETEVISHQSPVIRRKEDSMTTDGRRPTVERQSPTAAVLTVAECNLSQKVL
jgi:hypothetical protein